jgi:hypothetical protein
MNNFPLVLVDDYSIEEFASKLSNLDEKNVNNILKKITEDVKKASDGDKSYPDLRLDLYYDNAISESNDKEKATSQKNVEELKKLEDAFGKSVELKEESNDERTKRLNEARMVRYKDL